MDGVPSAPTRGRVAKNLEEALDQIAAAAAAPGIVAQPLAGHVARQRGPVAPGGRQRVEDIHQADDLGDERDGVAPQSVGVAASVEHLVMVADDLPGLFEGMQPGTELVADDRVTLHYFVLVRRER